MSCIQKKAFDTMPAIILLLRLHIFGGRPSFDTGDEWSQVTQEGQVRVPALCQMV
jgi:hypothetical protein